MTYLDAHNAKLRLVEDASTELYATYLEGMARSTNAQRRGGVGVHVGPQVGTNATDLQALLRSAETFTMSEPMRLLVQATSLDMPNNPLLPEELPSNTGFLYLTNPWEQIDLHGRRLMVHLYTWRIERGVLIVDGFTDRDDNRDEMNLALRKANPGLLREAGKYMLMNTTVLHFNKVPPVSVDCHRIRDLDNAGLPENWREHYLVYEEEFIDDEGENQVEFVPVLNEDSDLTSAQFELIQDAYRGLGTDPAWRLTVHPLQQLVCFWRMCGQTLAAREYIHPDRHLRKRMVKRQMATNPVTVITLRRRANRHEEGRLVEWDHRWIRRGHWRQQWYGSGEHRYQKAIYINPTICGPEDKPLLVRPHVNILAR
jgi:hypothetical protein